MTKENILFFILVLLCLFGPNVPPAFAEPVGFTSTKVTQSNLQKTVCIPGYTGTVRPPVSYTNRLKRKQMKELNLTGKTSEYEEDHFIPLAIGGHPSDERNLWPQPWEGEWNARIKDRLETRLHRLICTDQITLKQAQKCIKDDWRVCYIQIFGEDPETFKQDPNYTPVN